MTLLPTSEATGKRGGGHLGSPRALHGSARDGGSFGLTGTRPPPRLAMSLQGAVELRCHWRMTNIWRAKQCSGAPMIKLSACCGHRLSAIPNMHFLPSVGFTRLA